MAEAATGGELVVGVQGRLPLRESREFPAIPCDGIYPDDAVLKWGGSADGGRESAQAPGAYIESIS